MTDLDNSLVATRLAKRVSSTRFNPPPVTFADTRIPKRLLDYLSEHLSAGETHYTTRPGLTELREALGGQLGRLGGPERQADGVIVTQGEGEALYVSLLGLGIGTGSAVLIAGACAHRALLDMLGISVVGTKDAEARSPIASYREFGDVDGEKVATGSNQCVEIVALGGLLFSARSRIGDLSPISKDAILIGHLDSLPGLDHFRMGYVAGPPDVVKRIQTWKQALSICSAAPSQRAAFFSISQEFVS